MGKRAPHTRLRAPPGAAGSTRVVSGPLLVVLRALLGRSAALPAPEGQRRACACRRRAFSSPCHPLLASLLPHDTPTHLRVALSDARHAWAVCLQARPSEKAKARFSSAAQARTASSVAPRLLPRCQTTQTTLAATPAGCLLVRKWVLKRCKGASLLLLLLLCCPRTRRMLSCCV